MAAHDMTWPDHQRWEAEWWGDCTSTFGEENKQILYAHHLGLERDYEAEYETGRWPVYDLGGRSVLDVGGGPTSLLLKCRNRESCRVIDPEPYPDWVMARYAAVDIRVYQLPAEDLLTELTGAHFDEVWCYNVLQHVRDPELVIEGMLKAGRTMRVFDWIDTPPAPGHPNTLTVSRLESAFGRVGAVVDCDTHGCAGRAWVLRP